MVLLFHFIMLAAASSASAESVPDNWCGAHEATMIWDQASFPKMLPADFNLNNYDFDSPGHWFTSGSGNGERGLFKTAIDLGSYVRFASEPMHVLEASQDGTVVFASNLLEIHAYDTAKLDVFTVVQTAGNDLSFGGLAYDDTRQTLYASSFHQHGVYSYRKTPNGWSTGVRVAGSPDATARSDPTGLTRPRGIRLSQGDLFIKDDQGIVRWTPGAPTAHSVFPVRSFGNFGFEVVGDFLYYRYKLNSVYGRALADPTGESHIAVGGCGAGYARDKLMNGGMGSMRANAQGQLIVYDYYSMTKRFVLWGGQPTGNPGAH